MTRKRQDRLPALETELTGQIIGAFYCCYNELGFGFLESVYRRALTIELRLRGFHVVEEAIVEAMFRGVCVGTYRLDLLIEQRVVVEVKATALLGPADKRQLLNYLRASDLEVGLLLHFGPEPKVHRLSSTNLRRRPIEIAPSQETDPAVSASSEGSAFAPFESAESPTPEPPSTSPS
jgi:GxxExxY protein